MHFFIVVLGDLRAGSWHVQYGGRVERVDEASRDTSEMFRETKSSNLSHGNRTAVLWQASVILLLPSIAS